MGERTTIPHYASPRAVLGCGGIFTVALVAAAWSYPGGTFFERGSPGFSFWGNFWCDLLHEHALGGAPNQGAQALARLAFMAFACALACFWPLCASLCPTPRGARFVTRAGTLGALALLTVTLVPSHTQPLLHGVAVMLAALPSVLAAVVLGVALFARADPLTRGLWVGVVGSATVSLFQYVRQGFGAPAAHWLAGAQKCATLALLAFMVRCLVLVARARPR